MDMVDAPQNGTVIWNEHDFDSHGYALLCSYTHPDAPGLALDLVTDWYVWVFYFDDHFLELFKRTCDIAGAREYLDRLAAFMPVDGAITQTPANPVQHCLTDLISAADYACLINEVFSYQKEIQYEGEIHNCVLVVQSFLDCDVRKAFNVVTDLMTSRARQFEHVVSTELPALLYDFDLGADARNTLIGYAQELRDWLSGILTWHEGCHRYEESELGYHPATGTLAFGGTTGLGTSAARVGPFRGAVTSLRELSGT
jgi:hypothetical protein